MFRNEEEGKKSSNLKISWGEQIDRGRLGARVARTPNKLR